MLRTVKQIAHIIWDWNGTLLDDADLCVSVMNDVLGKRGLPLLTAERYAHQFRFPVREYYRELGFDFEQESFELVGTEFIEGYSAREAARGLRQSVLSASQQGRLEHQARRLEVHAHFEALVGLDDHYAASKVEVGHRWMELSGVNPLLTVLVGDTDHDVEVARALGVHCLLVPSGHQSPARLAKCGVEVLPGLAALLEVLAR